ncbi:helix-turn-helix domain-containing protein [Paenibacillus thalictri]|uniref:Helix-turn-helix domain-containing protein n=2 Tax=Paenibacillus thalictri TaxID=2527873 RepID=A0A4Q9DM85_9BACL|nr:helix-turn-helix domain-containing protein [Paenibacillus thalictri]
MSSDSNLSARLSEYIYKLESIHHAKSWDMPFQHEKACYGMLVFKEAEGDLAIDGRSYAVKRQHIFMLSPGAAVRLHLRPDIAVDYYYLRFYALQAAERQGQFEMAELACPDTLSTSYFPFFLDKIQEMEHKNRSHSGWETMKANILFQEMICVLFKQIVHEEKTDLQQAIALTLEHMELHYAAHITREDLAELAGLSADYYSRSFKKQVHKSPMEYLTDIRINQAKQRLVQSSDSFRSIAQSVGFSDEFYFSRKFKAALGCSPMAYVKKMKYSDRIASLNHLATGDLMALGIEPYAAVMNDAYPIAGRLHNTIAIGDSKPDLEILMSVKPDLIVMSGARHMEKSPKEKLFNQIAPTVTLDFFQSWRIHLQTIAGIVGKEKEARDWLERYDYKAETIRKQLSSRIGGETILILGIGDKQLCVFGQRNIGTVLYGDLHLAAPEGVRHITHYREIDAEELQMYDADRIVLACFRHDGSPRMDRLIRSEALRLYENQTWRHLKAVRNGRVYCMVDSKHLFTSYNALTHDLILDKAHQMLLS